MKCSAWVGLLIFFSDQIFFQTRNIFLTKFYLDQKKLWTKIFFRINFFFRIRIFFRTKIIFGPKLFSTKIFSGPIFFFRSKFFSRIKIFSGPNFFSGPKFFEVGDKIWGHSSLIYRKPTYWTLTVISLFCFTETSNQIFHSS